jgi:cytochrome c-type biogenesis protein
MEQTLNAFFASAPFLVSFLAGTLTFASPCVLPLIPAYMSYISGLSVKELADENSHITLSDRLRVLKSAALFTLGFSVIFVALGAAMAELIGDVFEYAWITWVGGGIIALFGLNLLGIFKIKALNFEAQSSFGSVKSKSIFAPFILGVSFALGWTPCVGPIFAAIIFKASESPDTAVWLMMVYAAGLAVPFLLTAWFTHAMLVQFAFIKRHFRVIEIISGALLLFLGIAIATGGLGKIAAVFS